MVLPDGTRPESRRPTLGRAAVGTIAALALVAGSLTLGALTTPDRGSIEGADTTSTSVADLERPIDLENFSVDQIAMGDPLNFERAAGVDGLYANQIVAHEGLVYVFSSTIEPWGDEPAPLTVWRSSDGRAWESLGTVLETWRPLYPVVSTSDGMVGVEPGDSGVTLWRSDDGQVWEKEAIPITEDDPLSIVHASAIAADDQRLVIAGNVVTDVTEILHGRLADAGVDIDLRRFGWGHELIDGERNLVVYGPLGLHLYEGTAEELGMSDEEFSDSEMGMSSDSKAQIWAYHEETGWQQRPVEGADWIESLHFAGPRLIAYGYGQTGGAIWVSEDGGFNWEQEGSSPPGEAHSLISWGDHFVAFAQGSLLDVQTSSDGITWEEAGLDDHFPYQLGWYGTALTAAESGIVFAAEGWDYQTGPSHDPPPVRLFDGDAVLSLDFSAGRMELKVGEETHGWNMYARQSGDGVEIDLDAEVIHFLDPESGETIATFTIDEITEAENSSWPGSFNDEDSFQALVSSPDAQGWTIQDAEASFGEGSRIFEMEVVGDSVIALVNSVGIRFDEPGFEIWTAPLH